MIKPRVELKKRGVRAGQGWNRLQMSVELHLVRSGQGNCISIYNLEKLYFLRPRDAL